MMSFHQRRIAKTRSISSLTTLNSCETNLRVPSLSVKSTSSVKRLSRRECRKLLKKKSTIRPIHQQSEKRTRSMDWYKQSPFEDTSSSSYSLKTTTSSLRRLISRVKSSKGQTHEFHEEKNNKKSYRRRTCGLYFCLRLCICSLILLIVGALIATIALLIKPSTAATTVITTSTTAATTLATTSTTATTTVTTTTVTSTTTLATTSTTVATTVTTTTVTSTTTLATTSTTATTTVTTTTVTSTTTLATTSTTVTTTVTTTTVTSTTTLATTSTTATTTVTTTTVTSTTTLATTSTTATTTVTTTTVTSTTTILTTVTTTTPGEPTCATCMVTYTDNYNIPLGNLSCNDACKTTHYYKSASTKFPSVTSSCNAIVTTSTSGTFCAYQLGTYCLTNNVITYYGNSYGNYSNVAYSGVGYFASNLAHCVGTSQYYCCCV